jgi:hypothetical protein
MLITVVQQPLWIADFIFCFCFIISAFQPSLLSNSFLLVINTAQCHQKIKLSFKTQ